MEPSLKKIVYIGSLFLVLLIMVPLSKYVAAQNLSDIILFITTISLANISCLLHIFIYKKIETKAKYNDYSQRNIIFASTVVFLELNGISYTIQKKENKEQFSFSVNWKKKDAATEQLRAIFCSLCIHNFKGITPTQQTKWAIQNDWEENLETNLTIEEKKRLWKKQSKSLQFHFKNNKKTVNQIHKFIQKNSNSEMIKNFVEELVKKN